MRGGPQARRAEWARAFCSFWLPLEITVLLVFSAIGMVEEPSFRSIAAFLLFSALFSLGWDVRCSKTQGQPFITVRRVDVCRLFYEDVDTQEPSRFSTTATWVWLALFLLLHIEVPLLLWLRLDGDISFGLFISTIAAAVIIIKWLWTRHHREDSGGTGSGS